MFLQLRSQFRVGMVGPTGLDYTAVLSHLRDGLCIPRKRLQPLYFEILAVERGALVGWHEAREEQRKWGD